MFNNQERRGNKRTAKPILASFRIGSEEAHYQGSELVTWQSTTLTINLKGKDSLPLVIYGKKGGL